MRAESGSVVIDAGPISGSGSGSGSEGGVYIGTTTSSEVQVDQTLFTHADGEQKVSALNHALWLTAETDVVDNGGLTVFVWAGDAAWTAENPIV